MQLTTRNVDTWTPSEPDGASPTVSRTCNTSSDEYTTWEFIRLPYLHHEVNQSSAHRSVNDILERPVLGLKRC